MIFFKLQPAKLYKYVQELHSQAGKLFSAEMENGRMLFLDQCNVETASCPGL